MVFCHILYWYSMPNLNCKYYFDLWNFAGYSTRQLFLFLWYLLFVQNKHFLKLIIDLKTRHLVYKPLILQTTIDSQRQFNPLGFDGTNSSTEESAFILNIWQTVGKLISQTNKKTKLFCCLVKSCVFAAAAAVFECALNSKTKFYALLTVLLAGRCLGYNLG